MRPKGKIENLLIELSKKYDLSINMQAFQNHKLNYLTDLAFLIKNLFPTQARGYFLDQGSPPSEYYPSLIWSYAETTGGDFYPKNLKVYSDDNWETASVSFINKGKSISFKIESVNNSDWVSPCFGSAMTKFAKKYLSGTWFEFIGEDWCTTLYIPKTAVKDFKRVESSMFSQDKLVELCREKKFRWEVFESVIKSPNINSVDSKGELPLNVVVERGNIELIDLLGEMGRPCLDPRVKNSRGISALDIAKQMDREDIVKILEDNVETYEWWEKKKKI